MTTGDTERSIKQMQSQLSDISRASEAGGAALVSGGLVTSLGSAAGSSSSSASSAAAASGKAGDDSLDEFMNTLTSGVLKKEKRTKIEAQLSELQQKV